MRHLPAGSKVPVKKTVASEENTNKAIIEHDRVPDSLLYEVSPGDGIISY